MKILQFDSVGGASGDMILCALVQLGTRLGLLDFDTDIVEPLKALIPDSFSFRWEEKSSHGMSGKSLFVDLEDQETLKSCFAHCVPLHAHGPGAGHAHGPGAEHAHGPGAEHAHGPGAEHAHGPGVGHAHGPGVGHAHGHRSFADIRTLIETSALPDSVKRLSLAVFTALAEAEGRIHGKPIDEVHFHEVGAADSIIDTVGACLALDKLSVDAVQVSPLPTGTGLIQCAHGTYPIPAPATAALLERFGMAISTDNEPCEMVTPTGAAELAVWSKSTYRLTSRPSNARIAATVHSFGHREMATRPNLLRLSLYETPTPLSASLAGSEEAVAPSLSEPALRTADNAVWLSKLECNLDDATGEQLSVAMKKLFDVGALDVWFIPITMKKQRCGVLLNALLEPEKREQALSVLFAEAGTFGVRETSVRRYSLDRRWESASTSYGAIRMKIGSRAGTDLTVAPEFDDCLAAAQHSGASVQSVMQAAVAAYYAKR